MHLPCLPELSEVNNSLTDIFIAPSLHLPSGLHSELPEHRNYFTLDSAHITALNKKQKKDECRHHSVLSGEAPDQSLWV